jgi:hypothetical protein
MEVTWWNGRIEAKSGGCGAHFFFWVLDILTRFTDPPHPPCLPHPPFSKKRIKNKKGMPVNGV